MLQWNMTKRRSISGLAVCVCLGAMLLPTAAVADPWEGPLSGSLTVAEGLVAGGNWGGTDLEPATTFSWEVTLGEGVWRYKYEFVAPDPSLSHLILQVSAPGMPDIQDFELAYPDYFNSTGDVDEIKWFLGDAADTGWPDGVEMYGIKFDHEGGTTYTLEFDSLRNPMVGSFYAKGGATSFAYNTGLGGGEHFIPVPNASYVPVPGAALLGFLGLGWAGMKLRKRV